MAPDGPIDGYRERYVAFLDLLGFKFLAGKAEVDRGSRGQLIEALSLLHNTLCNHDAVDMRLTHFSDCLVLSTEYSNNGLVEILQSISRLACNLLRCDILIRGGLVRGNLFHNQDYIYGTGLNDAYCMEQRHAIAPLVLLHSNVYSDAQAYGGLALHFIDKDQPGRYFVHYLLEYVVNYRSRHLPGSIVLDDDAARIAHFIGNRLLNDRESPLAKAEWFQKYWNRTAAAQGGFPSIEKGIVPDLPLGPGSRVIRRPVYAPPEPAA